MFDKNKTFLFNVRTRLKKQRNKKYFTSVSLSLINLCTLDTYSCIFKAFDYTTYTHYSFHMIFFPLPYLGRSGYTPITKHSQILDHKGPESDTTGYTSFDHGKDSSNWPHTHSASNEDITVSTSATNNQTGNLISTIYTISGYRYSAIRSFLFHVISILLIGIPYLLISWFPSLINLKYLKSELRFSDFVLGKLPFFLKYNIFFL